MAIDFNNLNGLTSESLQALVQEANSIIANRTTDEGIVDWAELSQKLVEYLNSHSIELRIILANEEEQTTTTHSYFITNNVGISRDEPGLITLRDYVPIVDENVPVPEEPEINDVIEETEEEENFDNELIDDEEIEFDSNEEDGSQID